MNWKPDPFAVGTNTYLANSGVINAYAFPSFCLIQICIAKVQKEWGGLVIGHWQTQPYFQMLLNMSTVEPIPLPSQKYLLLSPGGAPSSDNQ